MEASERLRALLRWREGGRGGQAGAGEGEGEGTAGRDPALSPSLLSPPTRTHTARLALDEGSFGGGEYVDLLATCA